MAYPFYQNPYYLPVGYQGAQQAPQQSGIIWVDDEREAAMYPIAPNNAVALWQKDGKTVYLKQADATGKPGMTVYGLEERRPEPSGKQDSISDEYVRKSDLESIRAEIESMKTDLYGVAGRKKSVKKGEDDE